MWDVGKKSESFRTYVLVPVKSMETRDETCPSISPCLDRICVLAGASYHFRRQNFIYRWVTYIEMPIQI